MDIYCTQLGMVTDLRYCLSVNTGLPCRNTVGCWQERIEIVRVLRAAFTEDELRDCLSGPPKTRMERIIESVKAANEEK